MDKLFNYGALTLDELERLHCAGQHIPQEVLIACLKDIGYRLEDARSEAEDCTEAQSEAETERNAANAALEVAEAEIENLKEEVEGLKDEVFELNLALADGKEP